MEKNGKFRERLKTPDGWKWVSLGVEEVNKDLFQLSSEFLCDCSPVGCSRDGSAPENNPGTGAF